MTGVQTCALPICVTGTELATQLRKRKPELKVIFTSGYSPEVVGRDFKQGDAAFLSKPYLPPQLAQMVRQCLDSEPKRDCELIPA